MLEVLKKYLGEFAPSFQLTIYKDNKFYDYVIGNKEEKPIINKADLNTEYDLASITKTFTATLIYIAYEEKLLDLFSSIYDIDNNFQNLKDVTVRDLLGHRVELWTDGYLGNAKTKEEFMRILYSAKVKSYNSLYVDSHFIILSTILEKIYNCSFKTLMEEKIIKPLNLTHTTFHPANNVASNNFEEQDIKIVDDIYPGLIHDTKGRVALSLNIYTGHASLFSTSSDLAKFLVTFIDGKETLLKNSTIKMMLEHEDTNKENFDKLYFKYNNNDINAMYELEKNSDNPMFISKTYNYMSARYLNKINALNDVPIIASKNTIYFTGYTGTAYLIDFDRHIIIAVLSNSIHNSRLGRIKRKECLDNLMNDIYKSSVNLQVK